MTDSATSTSTDFPSRWRLTHPILIAETFSSRIWKVTREDGTSAVVKALKDFPDFYDELRGAYLLKWRDGVGAVRLLGLEGRMMLLEYGGERLLTNIIETEGDTAATGIAAETLARLLTPSDHPAPPQLQPLRDRFASLFVQAEADRTAGRESTYVLAAGIAQGLLDTTRETRPLHGDLHHDNIIFGPRGWLAIDPKGVLGDPAFDAGNMFYNPLGQREGLCLDKTRIAFMAETFGQALEESPARILDHAFAYGCLSAAWHKEDGNAEDERLALGVAAAIRAVRLRF